MTFVAIFAQEDHLTGHKWQGLADLRDFGSDLLDAFFGLILLVGQFLEFFLVFIFFSCNVSGADTESIFVILIELLIKLDFGMGILLDFLFIGQVLSFISFELVNQFTFFFGQILHPLWFWGDEFVEGVNFTEALDEVHENVDFGFEVVFLWEDELLKRLFHWRNGGKVSNDFLSRLNDDILVEVVVFIHVGQEGEETVLVEHLDVVSLILVENVTEVNLEETKYHAWVNLIDDLWVLN